MSNHMEQADGEEQLQMPHGENQGDAEDMAQRAYLDTLRAQAMQDEHMCEAAMAVYSAQSMDMDEKCRIIDRLIVSGRVKAVLKTIETLSEDERQMLSRSSLMALQSASQKGHMMSGADMQRAKDALDVMHEALERAGEQRIAHSMADKAGPEKMGLEKMNVHKRAAYFAANMARETQKQRDTMLSKMRERIGVA